MWDLLSSRVGWWHRSPPLAHSRSFLYTISLSLLLCTDTVINVKKTNRSGFLSGKRNKPNFHFKGISSEDPFHESWWRSVTKATWTKKDPLPFLSMELKLNICQVLYLALLGNGKWHLRRGGRSSLDREAECGWGRWVGGGRRVRLESCAPKSGAARYFKPGRGGPPTVSPPRWTIRSSM